MGSQIRKNIVVCGYPKSGTVWATRLVAQLLDAPAVGYWGYTGESFVQEGEDRKSEWHCYKSHHHYKDLSADYGKNIDKIIYMVRDPRDILVSGMYHFRFYSDWLNQLTTNHSVPQKPLKLAKKIDAKLHSRQHKVNRMLNMLQNGDEHIANCGWGWNEHLSSYIASGNALIIKYEDLLQNGLETAKKILTHVGKEKSETTIKKDLHLQSFKVKKQILSEKKEVVKAKHMRKGIVGDWQNQIPKETVEILEIRHDELMKKLGYL